MTQEMARWALGITSIDRQSEGACNDDRKYSVEMRPSTLHDSNPTHTPRLTAVRLTTLRRLLPVLCCTVSSGRVRPPVVSPPSVLTDRPNAVNSRLAAATSGIVRSTSACVIDVMGLRFCTFPFAYCQMKARLKPTSVQWHGKAWRPAIARLRHLCPTCNGHVSARATYLCVEQPLISVLAWNLRAARSHSRAASSSSFAARSVASDARARLCAPALVFVGVGFVAKADMT